MTLLTLPSNREEAWRWADTAALAAAASSTRSGGDAVAEHFLDLPGDRLLFVDGELHPSSVLHRAEPALRPKLPSRSLGVDTIETPALPAVGTSGEPQE